MYAKINVAVIAVQCSSAYNIENWWKPKYPLIEEFAAYPQSLAVSTCTSKNKYQWMNKLTAHSYTTEFHAGINIPNVKLYST